MYEAAVFLAEGFEEIEALSVIDILRRGCCEVISVSLTGGAYVTGSRAITVKADTAFEAFSQTPVPSEAALILPGGPGTANLKTHSPLRALLKQHNAAGGRIAAICAAPSVLGALGLLNGKKAVCYPGFEPELEGALIGENAVETDGNITTSKGPLTAAVFAFELLRILKGEAVSEKIRGQMREAALKEYYANA